MGIVTLMARRVEARADKLCAIRHMIDQTILTSELSAFSSQQINR